MRQAPQGHDEEDAGNDDRARAERLRGHALSPFFLYIASMPLGDEEAAEDVHRGEDQRDEAEDLGPDRPVAQRRQRLDADRQ